jgi:hypothetical protein
MLRKLLVALLAVVVGGLAIAGDLKSGPQGGEKVPGPFHPLNINGEAAGKKNCLYCEAGDSPTALIFARNPNDPNLEKLIVALDDAAVKNAKAEMCSFVVFCTNDEKLEAKLKALAEKCKLKKLVLAIDTETGPEKYNLNATAEVTIVLYKDRVVAANHAFEKGKLSEADVKTVLQEVDQLVK